MSDETMHRELHLFTSKERSAFRMVFRFGIYTEDDLTLFAFLAIPRNCEFEDGTPGKLVDTLAFRIQDMRPIFHQKRGTHFTLTAKGRCIGDNASVEIHTIFNNNYLNTTYPKVFEII